jgi:hypothetical protein
MNTRGVSKKTKQGYLKDGFVVDSSDTDENEASTGSEEGDNDGEETEETEEAEDDGEIVIEDLGSELSEESYDYDPDP